MDLLAAIQAQHHIAALPVGPFDDIIVHQHTVGRQSEAEVLSLFLLHAPGIGHQVLDHLEVHQRFTAKEVHFQIASGAGMLDQKIQGLFAHFIAHDRAFAVVLALTGKAIGAIEIAGVGNVQAQGLDHACCLLLQLARHRLKGIGGEELACILQALNLIVTAFQFLH